MDTFLALFDLIGELARRRYQAADRFFSVLGLNHTEARLLTLLDREGGEATQEALSSLLFVDRSNAGRALKRLEQEEYVERNKATADKRANTVRMTPKGHAIVGELSRLRIEIAQSFFGELTEEEAGMAAELLRKGL
jgi:DNA-binding MarR family transcriptional regulator